MRLAAAAFAFLLGSALGPAAAQSPAVAPLPAVAPVPAVAPAAAPSDDPFLALEDAAQPQSQAYFRSQAAEARARLDRIPGRPAMLARIRALSEGNVAVSAIKLTDGARIFYLKLGAGQLTPALYAREGISGAERLVVDPERFTRGTSHAAIDWYVPSPDGRHVAYGVSGGGSEDSVLRVVVADTGRDLPLEIDRTRFNTDLAWHPDGRSFYYARIPEGGSGAKRYANIRVYRHLLGRDAARDEIVFASGAGGARDVPEFVYPSLHVPVDSRYAYAIARDGVRNEFAVHVTEQRELAAGRPRWHKLVGYDDEVTAIQGWKDDLYLLTHRHAANFRVLRVKATAKDLGAARVAVPEGDSVIQEMALAHDALYLRTMVAGVDRLERSPLGLLGIKAPEYVRTPFDSAIAQLVTHPRAPGALLRLQGWVQAPSVVLIEAKGGNVRETRLQPPASADFSAMDEVRLYAPSHDGVRIPVTLFYRKSTTLTGQNPLLLMGYGSYGISMRPTFDPARLAWLERGGIYAVAHLRGGGEYGQVWHDAGRRDKKVNTVLDFIAVADFLVKYGFTNPKKLAIQGTSAGGIPAGGALVRRPDLFGAVVGRVGVFDMLRFETMPSGPANVPEFGTASTPEGREALRAISPYQQVKDGTAYPAVLLTAGINDPRVSIWQPAKMAARLQQASTSGKPVLLRIDYESGHGRGTGRTQQEEELADIYSFLLWQLGDPEFQLPAPPPPPPPPLPVVTSPAAPDKADVTETRRQGDTETPQK